MSKKKIGIIFGGKSAEHEVSLQSAKNIVDAMDREKYDVVLIGIDKEGNWHLNDVSSYLINEQNPKLISLNKSNDHVAFVPGEENNPLIHTENASASEKLDVVFPIVHGTLGEDGSMQGMMGIADLPFVGASVLSSAICMDKEIAKRLLQSSDVHVARGRTYTRAQKQTIDFASLQNELGVPMFIKPANQGSSVGVSKVETQAEFEAGIRTAFQYDHKVLIEETLPGREIECSVLGNDKPIASLPGEVLPQTEFYSYESKYIDEKGAELAIPADLDDDTVKKIQEAAIQAFEALQCEGLARVDFFLTPDNDVYVNEVNTLPGFTKISMYPKLWEVSGLSYPDLIDRLIELAIERYQRDNLLKDSVWGDF